MLDEDLIDALKGTDKLARYAPLQELPKERKDPYPAVNAVLNTFLILGVLVIIGMLISIKLAISSTCI